MSLLDKSVTKADDDTWTFTCPGVDNSRCGDPATGRTFTSTGWPTKKTATARGLEHFDDHRGTPMTEMHVFMAKHGLVTDDQGKAVVGVTVDDLPTSQEG